MAEQRIYGRSEKMTNATAKQKGFCDVCKFTVVLEGHVDRCRQPRENGKWKQIEKDAWIGDTVHRLDVQLGLIMCGVSDGMLGGEMSELVSSMQQAKYWHSLNDTTNLAQPSGSSDHSVATAFECNYKGTFRTRYLRTVFPEHSETILEKWKIPEW